MSIKLMILWLFIKNKIQQITKVIVITTYFTLYPSLQIYKQILLYSDIS